MEKFVAYYRVSTRGQKRSGLGLADQQEVVQSFIAKEGAALVASFTEAASGKKDHRPELQKAIASAKKADASLLIAALDRFSRRVSFIANIMESGIGLTVATMPNASDFELHIHAALAQDEGRRVSLRTKAALRQAKKRGTVLGSNGRSLALANQKRADEFAGRMIQLIAAAGFENSYSEIARRLNAQGYRTLTGRLFAAQTVKNIISRFNNS